MQEVTYVRVFTDSKGESRFERVRVELAEANFAPPAPPLDVSAPIPAAQIIFTRVPAGWFGDFHRTPRRQWAFYLKGRAEVELSDGSTFQLGPGDAVLVEDTTGVGHRSRVIGDEDVVGVFVQLPD